MEKVFCTVDFDDPSQKANILQIIPAESSENRLLTREEEFHLFRKMNYLKYPLNSTIYYTKQLVKKTLSIQHLRTESFGRVWIMPKR